MRMIQPSITQAKFVGPTYDYETAMQIQAEKAGFSKKTKAEGTGVWCHLPCRVELLNFPPLGH